MFACPTHVLTVEPVYQMALVVLHANVLQPILVHDVKIKMFVLNNHVKIVVTVLVQVVEHTNVTVVQVLKDKIVNKVSLESISVTYFIYLLLVDICGVRNPCACGTCQNDASNPLGFRCFCPPGYSGDRCDRCKYLK